MTTLFFVIIANATPTDQSFSKMATVDTTGNVDKHIFVQRLNSSHSQTASIKHSLLKLPEKEEICKSIPDRTYPKDAVFIYTCTFCCIQQ